MEMESIIEQVSERKWHLRKTTIIINIFFEKPNIMMYLHRQTRTFNASCHTVYSIDVLDNSGYCQTQINTEFQKSSEIIVKRTFLRSDESFQPFNTFVLFDFFFKQKRFSKRNKTADKSGLSLDH